MKILVYFLYKKESYLSFSLVKRSNCMALFSGITNGHRETATCVIPNTFAVLRTPPKYLITSFFFTPSLLNYLAEKMVTVVTLICQYMLQAIMVTLIT